MQAPRLATLAVLCAVAVAYPAGDVSVIDDGSMLASQSGDLGEGAGMEAAAYHEVEAAVSLVHLKDSLDSLLKKGLDRGPEGDELGESASMGDTTLDQLLSDTCASTATKGYYDSSSCTPNALVLGKLIAHLKQRAATGHPLSFKEYGKLETFYAIQSMAELSKIHSLKKSKHVSIEVTRELYQQESKVLNALHAETEIANKAQAPPSATKKAHRNALETVAHSKHEIELAKLRLKHAETAESQKQQQATAQHSEDNALLYKTWGDKGVLKAEKMAVAAGHPEEYSTVKDETMSAAKMVTPMMRTVMPNSLVGVANGN